MNNTLGTVVFVSFVMLCFVSFFYAASSRKSKIE
jgi:hypothetical protein